MIDKIIVDDKFHLNANILKLAYANYLKLRAFIQLSCFVES